MDELRLLREEKYRRLLAEADRLAVSSKISERLFDKQKEVYNTLMGIAPYKLERYIAANCTRRAGKSDLVTTIHVCVAQLFPKSKTIMAGLTLDSISSIGWDLLLEVLEKENIKFKKNSVKKIIFYANGSMTRLIGIDAKEREMRKVLGQKLRLFTLDEAGSVNVDVSLLFKQMVNPALTDLRPYSWAMIVGTCEIIPNTYFEHVTTGKSKDFPWKVFKWSAYDNPYMKTQWTGEIDDLLRNNPSIKNASWFRTHYLNEWCADDELKIIDLKDAIFEQFKVSDYKNPVYGLGVDLGYNDASSFVIACYSSEKPWLHVVKSFKSSGKDLTDVANIIKKIQDDYPITLIVVDGANKQGVEEIRNRHGLALMTAEKHGKATYLRLLRDDVATGYVKIDPDNNDAWISEVEVLVWDKDDMSRTKEDPRCQNHCNDAMLYLWRECRAYIHIPDGARINKNTDEYMRKLEQEESDEMERDYAEKREDRDEFNGFI